MDEYERNKAKAESMVGKWIKEKGTGPIQSNEVCFVYDTEFDNEMNDWGLNLYRISLLFPAIELDSIYLEDLSYYSLISEDAGMRVYKKVRQCFDNMFEGHQKKDDQ